MFALLIGVTLFVGHLRAKVDDPLKSPQLKEYKEKLRLNPTDEQSKERIRQLDLQLRQRYFQQLARMGSGVYLLLGGVAVFVLAVTQGSRYRRQLPMPLPRPDAPEQATRAAAMSRWSVAASGATIGGFLFILSLGLSSALPKGTAEVERLLGAGEAVSESALQPTDHSSAQAQFSDAASPQELKQNWPRFRGADGSGFSMLTNVPMT